ncbi:MAG: sigma-70 family RNA polymerase sigma factor [Bacteroidales bacterium]|nr:sigma-70 family RNA polymerase sigma factor [Bacteroidales bacterium]
MISDIELVSLFQKTGDNALVAQLFKRYSRFTISVCMKYLKDKDMSYDAAMFVFEKILLEMKKYEIKNFKSWLHVVTKNHCLKLLQSKNYKNEIKIENDMEIYADLDHDNTNLQIETDNHIYGAIEKLKPEQKICIELFFIEEKTYKEIQELTGMEYNDVKSNIQNGKRNLKLMLEKLIIITLIFAISSILFIKHIISFS